MHIPDWYNKPKKETFCDKLKLLAFCMIPPILIMAPLYLRNAFSNLSKKPKAFDQKSDKNTRGKDSL